MSKIAVNVWDEKLEWNSLVAPHLGKLKSFKQGKRNVKDKSKYKGVETRELEFDLKNRMRVIRDEMAHDQLNYDKIKATDVPYKFVIGGFILFLFIMAGGSYIG
jgi:hypothetical protein